RRHPPAPQHPDVQPRRPFLPRCGRGPHAVTGGADRAAGSLPGVQRRRGRDHLGRRRLCAPPADAAGPDTRSGAAPMTGNWLADRRTEVAAERILDAAHELFTRHDAATVGMRDIARAAGCSRATLYRYFDSREALHTAYVHREARRLYRELGPRLAAIGDPQNRLIEGILAALDAVRENPAL